MSLFVTFEGVEGCGKSTQARRLTDRLLALGRRALLTREPGGTDATATIRTLLADPRWKLDPTAELLLFLADRAQHVEELIRPALAANTVVVCDRYSDSTMAYQGYGRGHALARLEPLNEWASRGLVPDLTIWIDTDIETGLRRARGGRAGDRFEGEPLEFHRRVRGGFEALAARSPERIHRIDGNAPVDVVDSRAWALVEPRLR